MSFEGNQFVEAFYAMDDQGFPYFFAPADLLFEDDFLQVDVVGYKAVKSGFPDGKNGGMMAIQLQFLEVVFPMFANLPRMDAEGIKATILRSEPVDLNILDAFLFCRIKSMGMDVEYHQGTGS